MKDTGDSSICEKADESRVESLLGLRRMGLKYFVVGAVPSFLGGFWDALLLGCCCSLIGSLEDWFVDDCFRVVVDDCIG